MRPPSVDDIEWSYGDDLLDDHVEQIRLDAQRGGRATQQETQAMAEEIQRLRAILTKRLMDGVIVARPGARVSLTAAARSEAAARVESIVWELERLGKLIGSEIKIDIHRTGDP